MQKGVRFYVTAMVWYKFFYINIHWDDEAKNYIPQISSFRSLGLTKEMIIEKKKIGMRCTFHPGSSAFGHVLFFLFSSDAIVTIFNSFIETLFELGVVSTNFSFLIYQSAVHTFQNFEQLLNFYKNLIKDTSSKFEI